MGLDPVTPCACTTAKCIVCSNTIDVRRLLDQIDQVRTNAFEDDLEAGKAALYVRNQIKKAITELGKPRMDYQPTIANEERKKSIKKACDILLELIDRHTRQAHNTPS